MKWKRRSWRGGRKRKGGPPKILAGLLVWQGGGRREKESQIVAANRHWESLGSLLASISADFC